eukprot:Skav227004  [mRNA]  locus=scaffold969:2793:14288:- [translate_table: standard]
MLRWLHAIPIDRLISAPASSGSLAFVGGPTSRQQIGSRSTRAPQISAVRAPSSASSSASGTALWTTSLLAAAIGTRCCARKSRTARAAYASAPQTYEGAPIGPPPDLPSLLLKERIVYLGTPITAEVTELIIAQLLYLNYESADKPITLYINSTGSTIKNNTRYIGESKVGMETDAFAIADCMGSPGETLVVPVRGTYIKPDIQTIAIGQAAI